MKAYIVKSEAVIFPFGDQAKDCLIANKPLHEWQEEILEKLGIAICHSDSRSLIADQDSYLVLDDNLFFTEELLRQFLTKAEKWQAIVTCALKKGVTTERTAVKAQNVLLADGWVEYGLVYYPAKEFRNSTDTIVINPDEFVEFINMPRHMCGADNYALPITEKLIIQLDHWVNVWVINILLALSGIAKLKKSSKLKLLWLAFKARSLNKWTVLKNTNRFGVNCDIHPTAYIEGSVIGDQAVIGAGAIIRNSIIGDNVCIGNGVVVEESVIGSKSTVLRGQVLYSVLYPESFSVSGLITASLMGRETFAGAGSVMTDFRFDGKNVTVLKDGQSVDSGNRFLGSCLGHRSRLGAGCIIAPGRAIPCDMNIIAENLISTFPLKREVAVSE